MSTSNSLGADNPFHEPFHEQRDDRLAPFKRTHLYRRWYNQVVRPADPNDFVIAISPSGKTQVTNTGKTTLGVTLSKALDYSDPGFDAETNATLDAQDLAYETYPQSAQHSALLWDEAQGAPGTDGLDSRRSMADSTLAALRAVVTNRNEGKTLIIITQQLGWLDSRLYPLLDAWLLIRRAPSHPQGPSFRHHKFNVSDYDLKNPKEKTPVLETLTWPDLPDDDPDYRHLSELKESAKNRGSDDDESADAAPAVPDGIADLPLEARDAVIKDLREGGVDRQKLADRVGVSASRISQITNDSA
jgi:hypothetical protein